MYLNIQSGQRSQAQTCCTKQRNPTKSERFLMQFLRVT